MVSDVLSDHKPGLLWSLTFLVITNRDFMVSDVLSDHKPGLLWSLTFLVITNRDFYGF